MPVSAHIILELLEQKKSLEDTIQEKTKELQQVNTAIASLEGNIATTPRYNWSENAMECIKTKGIFLQTTEILECTLFDSDDLQDEKKKRNAIVGISVALNNLCSKGFLRKIVVQGVKGHFYGLPDWFEDVNTPKREYLANFMARYGRTTEPLKLNSNDVMNIIDGIK